MSKEHLVWRIRLDQVFVEQFHIFFFDFQKKRAEIRAVRSTPPVVLYARLVRVHNTWERG